MRLYIYILTSVINFSVDEDDEDDEDFLGGTNPSIELD